MGLLDFSGKKDLSLILSSLGLLGAKKQPQADKYSQMMFSGLLNKQNKEEEERKKQEQIQQFQSALGDTSDPMISALIQQGQFAPAATLYAKGMDKPTLDKDMLKYQSDVRKEVTPIAEALNEMKGNFQSLVSSAQADDKSRGAADQAMIFSFAKMLDPRSVVRTEEGQAIARTDGYFGQLQGFLNQIKGDGQLTPGARRGLVLEAQRQMKSKSTPLLDRVDWYKNDVIGDNFPHQKAISPGLLGYRDWMNNYQLPEDYGPMGAVGVSGENPERADSFIDKIKSRINQ